MPKSRLRKNRRPYKPRRAPVYGSDPLALFRLIGTGALGQDEDEAACAMLLHEMKEYDPKVMDVLVKMSGLSEPPTTTDDIRAIAKALTAPTSEPADAPQP